MPHNPHLKLLCNKAFAAILLLFCCNSLIAQTKYGVLAGAGKSSLFKFAVPPADYNCYSSASSYWGGITINKTLIKNEVDLFIAAAYNKKGYKYLLQKETGTNNSIKDSGFTQKINYVDLNLNLRKKFMFGEESTNSFFAGTGPVVSFLAGGKEEIQADYFGSSLTPVDKTNSKLTTGSGPGKYKPTFFSWSICAGFEFNNLSLYINANIPLTDYFQDARDAVKHKVKTFGITAAYTLYTHQKREKPERPEKTKKTKDHDINIPVVTIDTLADRDGDGVADVHDKCPGIKGSAKYGGCPVPDTDGDGINDDDDQCITVAGVAANHGCPVKVDTAKINTDTTCFIVYFEPGKSILKTEAFETLDKVVKLLKANPKLVAVFKGHTDNVGSQEANYNRSLLRASVSADYVASFYIDKNRLTILSLGNKMPAADLNDPLVQWKNRRVEICVFEATK
ncbi:OmpA family protein [Ferruginibacter sp. SUN106]|uniref:OmpA family protein n=1 Tax=Ferruginibacter sp. SUN106 TaxID=2978348 RepID=UPI003D36D37F